MNSQINRVQQQVQRLQQCVQEANQCCQQINQDLNQLSFATNQSAGYQTSPQQNQYSASTVGNVLQADRNQYTSSEQPSFNNYNNRSQNQAGGYGGQASSFQSGSVSNVMQADRQSASQGYANQSVQSGGQYQPQSWGQSAGFQSVINADRNQGF